MTKLRTTIDQLAIPMHLRKRVQWLQGAVWNGDATDAERKELHDLITSCAPNRIVYDYSMVKTKGRSVKQIESDKRAVRKFTREAEDRAQGQAQKREASDV